jgi:phosphoglycerate dehydrogenase-like enzyme
LFGDRLFQGAKPNQVLVSLAHSNLFDERALAAALAQGPLAAAWMDSLEPGALDADRPLHRVATLQVTPRVSGVTQGSRLRGAWAVAQRIDEMLMNSQFSLDSATAASSAAAPSAAATAPVLEVAQAVSPPRPAASAGPAGAPGSA